MVRRDSNRENLEFGRLADFTPFGFHKVMRRKVPPILWIGLSWFRLNLFPGNGAILTPRILIRTGLSTILNI